MIASTLPPPPYECYCTEIIFRGDNYHIERITHRKGHKREVRHELVIFPGSDITVRRVAVEKNTQIEGGS